MYELSQAFHRARRERNRAPVVLFTLSNAFGVRVYSNRLPAEDVDSLKAAPKADGTWLADGSWLAGYNGLPALERAARVLSFGTPRASLLPVRGQFLASLGSSEAATLSVTLSNSPQGPPGSVARPFTRLEAVEHLLGARGELTVGYRPEVPLRDYLTLFRGKVAGYSLTPDTVTLTLRAA